MTAELQTFTWTFTLMIVKEMNGLVVESHSVNRKVNPLNPAVWLNLYAFYNNHL
jgi:hypothetical protein